MEWRKILRNPAYWLLGAVLLVALGRDLIANGRPLYCRIAGETYFPGLRTIWVDPQRAYAHPTLDSIRRNNLWHTFPYESAFFAPIPFAAGEIASRPALTFAQPGTLNPSLPGGRFRHWVGTDGSGRDVAASLVYGARIAVQTGGLAMLMALLIGMTLGSIAGFWGDERLKMRRGVLWGALMGLLIGWFYGFVARADGYSPEEGGPYVVGGIFILVGFVFLWAFLGRVLGYFPFFKRLVTVPFDFGVMRLSELFQSIPRLVFVMTIGSFLGQSKSIWLLIALIGALGWVTFARHLRSELLRIRALDYISAARGMGLSEWRILWRHAIPNALRPIGVAFALGMANAILLESALTFLGYGGDAFTGRSWGSLLAATRENPEVWWIAIPPGLLIGGLILSLNQIAEEISA